MFIQNVINYTTYFYQNIINDLNNRKNKYSVIKISKDIPLKNLGYFLLKIMLDKLSIKNSLFT